MGAEQFVDVTCRGLEVGKSLKLLDFGPTTAFLEAAAPVPVGSPLEILTDAGVTIRARVLRVQEQVAGAEMPPGMRVAAVELGGKASSWWQEQVSRPDPVIPEPAAGGARAVAAVDLEAVPVAAPSEVTIPSAGVPGGPDRRRPAPARTQIMSVTEIEDAIAAGGQHLDSGDGTPTGELDVMTSNQVNAEGEGGGNGESDDAGGSGSRKGRNKKKKRR